MEVDINAMYKCVCISAIYEYICMVICEYTCIQKGSLCACIYIYIYDGITCQSLTYKDPSVQLKM